MPKVSSAKSSYQIKFNCQFLESNSKTICDITYMD